MVVAGYSILPWLGARWAQYSETSIRHRINATTLVATTAPLQMLEVAPETKDETDIVVSKLWGHEVRQRCSVR